MAKDAKKLEGEIKKTEEEIEKYNKTLGPAVAVIRQTETQSEWKSRKKRNEIGDRMSFGAVGNYREQVKRLVYARQKIKGEEYWAAVNTMDHILKYDGPNKEKLYTQAGLDCAAYAKRIYKNAPDRAEEFKELAHDFEKKLRSQPK